MENIRLTYECPCANFDVVYGDIEDWNQGAVVVECGVCKRTLHQMDGVIFHSPDKESVNGSQG